MEKKPQRARSRETIASRGGFRLFFRDLGFRDFGFRSLGFRDFGFRAWGCFRVLGLGIFERALYRGLISAFWFPDVAKNRDLRNQSDYYVSFAWFRGGGDGCKFERLLWFVRMFCSFGFVPTVLSSILE